MKKALGLLLVVMGTAVGGFAAIPKFIPFGVNFSPYENGQNPSLETLVIKTNEVLSRLKGIAGDSQWIRSYSVTHGLETVGALAHRTGFKVALGAWLGPENDTVGLANNEDEIANLVAAANRGEADMLIVGSEVLQRGDLPASMLISYMQQVRAAVPSGIPITTADTYGALIANPDVITASDVIAANFYPYWEGVRIDESIDSLDGEYRLLVQAAGSKEILVSETGWPSSGSIVGLAAPSSKNAAYYFIAFNSWASANNISAFYFEAYDEQWKALSEGAQGAHWGIRSSTGVFKAGMNLVYEGYTLPSAIVMRQIPVSTLPGSPTIQLTRIPAYGSGDGIAGTVSGIQTANYQIATYINVAGSWWIKPTFANPTVPIYPDGSFTCDTVTGGNDADATEYEVFVIPSDYFPPAAGGTPSVPSDIFSHSVASIDFQRPPGYKGHTNNLPTVRSLLINRSFRAAANAADTAIITGTISITNTAAFGANVTISIGLTDWQFAALAKNGTASVSSGNWNNPAGRISVIAGKNAWIYTAILKCALGNPYWDEYGLLDSAIMPPGVPIFMPVTITVNGQVYTRTAAGFYTAASGKNGILSGTSTGLAGD